MKRRGISLIELLVILAIIGFLAGLFFALARKPRDEAKQAQQAEQKELERAREAEAKAVENQRKANEAVQATLKNPTIGTPALKSIEAISFGPNGLLLIGDGKGKQLVAIDTGDTNPVKWAKMEVPKIQETLAGRIGTSAEGIKIVKMAVNPSSHTAYFAIHSLDNKKDLLLTMDGAGKTAEFSLDKVRFVAVPLPAEQKVTLITDVTWAGDRVLVSAQASDTFGSKVFSVMAPLANDGACVCFSTETYHVAHRQWETRAPIRTVIPYEEGGKKYLVGAFTCTPIVKYSLEDLKPGAKVKGVSVIELGSGNTPQDMFVYEKNGKKFILMNQIRFQHKQNPVGPSPYWTAKVDFNILKEASDVNEKAVWRIKGKASVDIIPDRAQIAADYHGVVHMDRLDANRALVLRTADKGLDLRVLNLP